MYATSIDSPARQAAAGGGVTTAARPVPDPATSRADSDRPPTPVDGAWALEYRLEAAAEARRITRTALEAWQLGDDPAEVVLLVVSELVTNAVEHAQAPIHLHLHADAGERVWIGVSDGGPVTHDDTWPLTHPGDEHGRGLALVDAVAELHGTHTHLNGHTTHWARINPQPV
ncbi:ATP-binding protein [Streptomyces sp. NPDC005479]|uniref:ATP-binding protein n=1 Tax=Streptomyces sp. NPDC005479 TaxID=3154879 RepID=UPI0033A5B661